MTCALREGGFPQKQTIVLIACVSVINTSGEGGAKSRKFCERYKCKPKPKPKPLRRHSQHLKQKPNGNLTNF